MAVFKDFQSLLYRQHLEFRDEIRDRYTQARMKGGSRFILSLHGGKIASMRRQQDLTVDLCLGRKDKKGWRVYREHGADLGLLNDLEKRRELCDLHAQPEADPRPARPTVFEPGAAPGLMPNYDPLVDSCEPSLVFHRLFQTLAKTLESGFLVDAEVIWQTGAYSWDGRSLSAGFIDYQNFYFSPQTHIEERITVYPQGNPYMRTTVCHSSHALNQMADLSWVAKSLCCQTSLLRRSAGNIDVVVLPCAAVVQCLRPILEGLSTRSGQMPKISAHKGNLLSSGLELSCDGHYMGYDGIADELGAHTERITMISAGQLRDYPSTSNGHILDAQGQAGVFFPVLRGDLPDPQPPEFLNPLEFSQWMPGRVLFLEPPQIRCDVGLDPVLYFSLGGGLYQDGCYLGHVMGSNIPFPVYEVLGHASALGLPQRIGNMAVCALNLDTSFFLTYGT